jgi:hypothetical protein
MILRRVARAARIFLRSWFYALRPARSPLAVVKDVSTDDLAAADHFFRHIKKSWIEDDFINPLAFRLSEKELANVDDGLSINWVEYFQKTNPQDAVAPLVAVLEKKRKIGGESRFALLNVKAAKEAAAQYSAIQIVMDREDLDPSHALVKGYASHNDQVAEELQKVIMASYQAKP